MPTLETLRERFNTMLREYRTEPELEGHTILSTGIQDSQLVVRVRSNRGNEYTVTIGNNLSCTCEGFRRFRRCKHLLFVIQQILNGYIQIPENLEVPTFTSIRSFINHYSHRTTSIPIFNECYGLEIEVKLKSEYQNLEIGDSNLRELISMGLLIERDASVDVEFKTPILGPSRAWNWVTNPYWERLTQFQDRRFQTQGIHVHVNMDTFFDVDKRASSETCKFLHAVAEVIENAIEFKKVFLRPPNQYCRPAHRTEWSDRYCWINLTNLRKNTGKTIEIRGFWSRPEKLPEILFKAKYIANLFIKALLAWREDNKPSPSDWFTRRKILQLLSRKELYFTLMALHIKEFPIRAEECMSVLEKGIKNPLEVF
ncbi:SWIM zinc finger family protein [Desulfurobacterium crinifex]